MAKGTLTVRLPEETLELFKTEAKAEGKTVSEVVIEAILAGRESKLAPIEPTPECDDSGAAQDAPPEEEVQKDVTLNDVMFRIASLEDYLLGNLSALGELSLRVARISAASSYYARMNAKFSLDISSLVATSRLPDATSRRECHEGWSEKCKQFEQQILTMPYEDLIEAKFNE